MRRVLLGTFLVGCLLCGPLGHIGWAAPGDITVFAGGGVGDGNQALQAHFDPPAGLALDSAGNLYIADTNQNRIRKLDTSGIVSTVAGNGTAGYSGDGDSATKARLNAPTFVAVGAGGSLYIGDTGNHRIRKVDPSGIITTVAGNGIQGFVGDGGPATVASLSTPADLALDDAGNLYLSDTGNHRVRRVSVEGTISTVAGNGVNAFAGDGFPAIAASLNRPTGIALDEMGNLYIADYWNNRIRKVNASGTISTVAGNGIFGSTGDGGPATAATLGAIDVEVDAAANLYIASGEWGGRIRKVDPSGTITTVAGSANTNNRGDGGPATEAWLDVPIAVASDPTGTLYISEAGNRAIVRKVDGSGIISTLAGNGRSSSFGDGGRAVDAGIFFPSGLASDADGNLYFAELGGQVVHKVDASGKITRVAGIRRPRFSGDGGPATEAGLDNPGEVAFDRAGNLFIADRANYRVRKVDASGIITTVAGNGTSGFSGDGGPATEASLFPAGIGLDAAGNLYIADELNNRIRRVDTSGLITTVAGTGEAEYSGDAGPALQASLGRPAAVEVESAGNIYIADTENHRIRRIDISGVITTVAGTGTPGFSGDEGPASSAQLNQPSALTFDSIGNLYFVDSGNRRVRMIDQSGTITTVAGPTTGYGVGLPFNPVDVALDRLGNLYVTDGWNELVLRIEGDPVEQSPTAVAFTERTSESGQFSDEVLFEARLTDSSGNPLANVELTFELTGPASNRVITAMTDADGIAPATEKLQEEPGTYQLTVRYAGDESRFSSSDTMSLVVSKEDTNLQLDVIGQGNSRWLRAVLSDGDTPSDGVAQRSIDFYADGIPIGTAVTDQNGDASMQPPRKYLGGKHQFEARFEGDSYYLASSGQAAT